MKLGIIFGSISTEHDVSIVSASSIIKNLNKDKYEIHPIYIDEKGTWYHLNDDVKTIDVYQIGAKPQNITKITNVFEYLNTLDCLFPVLHGYTGEDGGMQGLFRLIQKPFVGCDILASSICMDKVYTKIILDKAGIQQSPSIYIRKDENLSYIDEEMNAKEVTYDEIDEIINQKFGYPVFIKPSNSGSSVGVSKTSSKDELQTNLENALKYDCKVLIEKAIQGKEVECAVLGNQASRVGEVLSAEDFYTFDAKYKNSASKTVIPASIPSDVEEKIRSLALKAFMAVDGYSLSRIDFFVEDDTNEIYLNEINTLPGFTEISMYPKLVESLGISYPELLDILIEMAMNR